MSAPSKRPKTEGPTRTPTLVTEGEPTLPTEAGEEGGWTDNNFVCLTNSPLERWNVSSMVVSPSCGAVATFIGTTRDNFVGKKVVCLEYEAYRPMAIKQMRKLCEDIRSKWQVSKIAVLHRLGRVDVGEASVVIGVSSDHRKEALEACHFAIDHLKATIPIWKKEQYQDGSTWKQNREYDPAKLTQAEPEEKEAAFD